MRTPRSLMGLSSVIVMSVMLLAGCSDDPTVTPTPDVTATETTEPTPTETAEPTSTPSIDAVEIEVEEGRVEGPDTITVAQGDTVRIEVEVDAADHVHVHGYDLMFDVEPGGKTPISFEASIPGIFEIELEDAGVLLTRLEVTA